MMGWYVVRRRYSRPVVRIIRIDVAYGRQFAGYRRLVNTKSCYNLRLKELYKMYFDHLRLLPPTFDLMSNDINN